MSQFYFHLRSQTDGLSPDELGLDLPDVETAYLEADRAVRDMARELLRKGKNPRDYAFEITTASGDLVLDLPFSETLDRQIGRHVANLARTIRTAKERGERAKQLTSEVAEQAAAARENLGRTLDLVQSLNRIVRTEPYGMRPEKPF